MNRKHHLKSARLGGQSLRYVAEAEGQWVALITFSGAAPHTKARELKIRWTPRQRARRLCFVVNNSRFLVLPERQHYPNLASRVLALCLKRLNADWQERWGHPVVLVESYVDESRYRGTCYRACGFQAVGLTAGYGRWQFLAVWREREQLRQGKVTEKSEEYSYYCTSAAPGQYSAAQLVRVIRDHWSASENGAHYRRDVSLGEDASTISGRNGAFVMATLRNLLLGLFELQKHRRQTKARTFPGWRRTLTQTQKIQFLIRKRP